MLRWLFLKIFLLQSLFQTHRQLKNVQALNGDGKKTIYEPTSGASTRVIVLRHKGGENQRVHPGVMSSSLLEPINTRDYCRLYPLSLKTKPDVSGFIIQCERGINEVRIDLSRLVLRIPTSVHGMIPLKQIPVSLSCNFTLMLTLACCHLNSAQNKAEADGIQLNTS